MLRGIYKFRRSEVYFYYNVWDFIRKPKDSNRERWCLCYELWRVIRYNITAAEDFNTFTVVNIIQINVNFDFVISLQEEYIRIIELWFSFDDNDAVINNITMMKRRKLKRLHTIVESRTIIIYGWVVCVRKK